MADTGRMIPKLRLTVKSDEARPIAQPKATKPTICIRPSETSPASIKPKEPSSQTEATSSPRPEESTEAEDAEPETMTVKVKGQLVTIQKGKAVRARKRSPEEQVEYQRQYAKQYAKEWRAKNKERIKAYSKGYYQLLKQKAQKANEALAEKEATLAEQEATLAEQEA